MTGSNEVWNKSELKERYGEYYSQSPRVTLDASKIPGQLWPLIPYAEFWGISDDWTREALVKDAPPDVLENLKCIVRAFDPVLTEWLAGPEAESPTPDRKSVV